MIMNSKDDTFGHNHNMDECIEHPEHYKAKIVQNMVLDNNEEAPAVPDWIIPSR